ncbi:MAG: hypothetical protein JW940_30485 [Polyangiaceae bacterium]|nr:hypothetical protein [Polyangiaceae bacterium]
MRFRAPSSLFALWVCVGRAEPACAAAEQPQPTGSPAPSSETQPQVLDVWLRAEDPAWIARAEGQLSDLPVRVHVIRQPVEADPEQQLASGNAVHAAGLVAWLSPDARAKGHLSPEGEGAYLLVWSAPAQRLYVRRVGPTFEQSNDLERSATLEIAALALRTATRAALSGRSLDFEAHRLRLPEASDELRAGPAALPTSERSSPRWLGGARASVALDGRSDAGIGSLGAEVQLETRAWRIGASAEVGLPSTLESRQAKLIVRRHVAAAMLGRVAELSPTIQLIPRLWAGVAGFHRETQPQVAELDPSDANTTISGLLGAGCSLQCKPFAPSFLALELGAAWVPGAPTLRLLHEDGRILVSHRLWRLEPQAGLQVGLSW